MICLEVAEVILRWRVGRGERRGEVGRGLNSSIKYFLIRQARKLKSAKKWGREL